MDFNALRAQTLGSGADEEAVTVNTRALIDKVLARYSGEWTVLRELIQNAADASATKITIKFETVPSATVPLPANATPSSLLKHTIQHHTLKRLIVTNNGQPFNENDWTRLKRIAEGNPDETKIGAFGVGFYSTFADCEEPFISSGKEAMAFFWKNNSLFTRRLKLPDSETNTDTNFVLDYRDTTSVVPALLPLSQFLASSLTFVGIENIELFVDEWNVLSLVKKTSPSQDVSIPRDIEPKTSEGFMKVTKVSQETAQIDGHWMPVVKYKQHAAQVARSADRDAAPSLRKFFSRLAGTNVLDDNLTITNRQHVLEEQDLTVKVHATVFLSVSTASVKTYISQKFNEELERATKKPPPKTTKLAILTAPYVDKDALAASAVAGDIFSTVLPSKSGKIFIGFPTHQTTGLSAHVSAPSVIPTVERESIDLNARWVRTWNMEMLRIAGIVCRIAWAFEMATLRTKIARLANGQTKIRMDTVSSVLPEAITTVQNFTFRESTPSPKTGELLEDGFWRSGKKASIEILSTCGVLPTHEVRIAPKDLSFVEGVPVLPEKLVQEAKKFVDKLTEFGLITEVTVADIKRALESNPLSNQQVTEFLSWLTTQSKQGQLEARVITDLLSVAVAHEEGAEDGISKLSMLGSMNSFLNPSRIPTTMPVPETVVPFKYSKSFPKQDLESIGWQELQIVPWMRWLISEKNNRNVLQEDQDLTQSASFSNQVWPLLSKQWDAMSQSSRSSLVELLSSQTVVPTKLGMKKPAEAYFSSVKIFDDLPTITGLNGVREKVLVAFGVRKTVELGVVFDRLLKPEVAGSASTTTKACSHVALIQYLASVRDDIPASDMHRLRNTPFCSKEVRGESSQESQQKFKVSELFEPRPQLRELGLPVLTWPGPYRSTSAEGRFLSSLGLRTSPTVDELVDIMAVAGPGDDQCRYDKAMGYFVSFHRANGYGDFDFSTVSRPFLPLEGKPNVWSTPSQCFTDQGSQLLGFDLLKRELQVHAGLFGVLRHPPLDKCITLLVQRPPTTRQEAKDLFAYFATRLGEFNNAVVPMLQDLNFVPIFVTRKEKSLFKYHSSPRNVFLGDSETFGEIFEFVDFGPDGNTFLLQCGSKPEPSTVQVAHTLVREPTRIFDTFRSQEKYLSLLRNLASNVDMLKKNKELLKEMRRARFLLASKHIPSALVETTEKGRPQDRDDLDGIDEDEQQGITEWQLCSATDAVILDDIISFNRFKADLLVAPQEQALEDFYMALGTPSLKSLVDNVTSHGPRAPDQKPASALRKLILERVVLFLHDQPSTSIKHDDKWLEKKLSVQLVTSISLRRTLRGRNLHSKEKRTASVGKTEEGWTLWIVGARPDLYQVSHALVALLLNRDSLHTALTLEMFLKTDLLELRARGFNVSRILRLKAAEARLAESNRERALEEEQKRISEQQKLWKPAQEPPRSQSLQQASMAGAFPDSPDGKGVMANGQRAPHVTDQDHEPMSQGQSLFSNIKRNLGFGPSRGQRPDSEGTATDVHRPQIAGSAQDPPPPYSQNNNAGTNEAVTAPHQLRNNLLSAIRKTRAHNSSTVFSRGETHTVSETQSYCDERPAHNLALVAGIKHGIQMFYPKDTGAGIGASAFLQQNAPGLAMFADLLGSISDVFSLDPRTLNVFHETSGKTIAFNSNGSIFCNYLYFKQLHEENIKKGTGDAHDEAMIYWWVTLCHELAHNLVADHSSNHSFYTEGFVARYFGQLAQKLDARGQVEDKTSRPDT